MRSIFKFLGFILMVCFFTQCNHNPLDIDTSNISVNPVVFKRLDKELFSLTPQTIDQKTKSFQKEYGSFYNRYVSSILNNGGIKDSVYASNIIRFTTDKDMRAAYNDVIKTYQEGDIEHLNSDMTEVLKRFKVFFPNRKTPKQFVTFMSGFNYSVVYVDSTIGVGLEMYLGSTNSFYQALQFPKYKSRAMNKDYLLSDAVRGWMIAEFDNTEQVNTLLHHMIFYGKIAYACDGLLPDVHDSIKLVYTNAQLNYCKHYENKLWTFIAKDNNLFANDLKLISEFTNDGPNLASSISKDCPPRIAMWLGRQIIKSYMKHNEKVTLNELMNEKDVQKILSKSKYRP